MMSAETPLLLFAKAPIAGKVKTRLQSHCSAEQAAGIACILLEESILKALAYWPGRVCLSVSLDQDHPFFSQMLAKYPVTMTSQCAGDLGAKMHHALERYGYPAAVMGCDAPHVSGHSLKLAHQYLNNGKSVIGPSHDGGYYLLGLADSCTELFQAMSWGSDKVLIDTLTSASNANLALNSLDALNDIDKWPDLLEALDSLPRLYDYLKWQELA